MGGKWRGIYRSVVEQGREESPLFHAPPPLFCFRERWNGWRLAQTAGGSGSGDIYIHIFYLHADVVAAHRPLVCLGCPRRRFIIQFGAPCCLLLETVVYVFFFIFLYHENLVYELLKGLCIIWSAPFLVCV